jgi:hypothetical protein
MSFMSEVAAVLNSLTLCPTASGKAQSSGALLIRRSETCDLKDTSLPTEIHTVWLALLTEVEEKTRLSMAGNDRRRPKREFPSLFEELFHLHALAHANLGDLRDFQLRATIGE